MNVFKFIIVFSFYWKGKEKDILPVTARAGHGQNLESETPSPISPVAGTQVLEPWPAVSQGALQQEAEQQRLELFTSARDVDFLVDATHLLP